MKERAQKPSAGAPRVGVAIAVHNSWGVLVECLERLEQSETRAELFIVVCDDGSTDGTREGLSERFPAVKVVRGDGSLWWTGGTNRAVELCLLERGAQLHLARIGLETVVPRPLLPEFEGTPGNAGAQHQRDTADCTSRPALAVLDHGLQSGRARQRCGHQPGCGGTPSGNRAGASECRACT